MVHKIHIISEQNRVVIQLSGHVTGKEIIAINQEINENVDFISQLWNLLGVGKVDISHEEMHRIAMQDNSLPLNSRLQKLAIVGPEVLLNEWGDVYERFSKDWVGRRHYFESKFFNTLEEASEWIISDEV